MEENIVSMNYERAYDEAIRQLEQAKRELEEYKKALLNLCLKL